MGEFDLLTGEEKEETAVEGSYTKPEAVELSEELYREYKSSAETWRTQVADDRDFYDGIQWSVADGKKKKIERRNSKAITVDIVSPAVDQAVAMLTSNKPRFSATGREDSDTRVARVFSDLLAYIWDFNKGNQRLKQTIKDYYVSSCGWFVVYWDSLKDNGRGEICIRSVDPLNVFVSPSTVDFFFADTPHVIIATEETSEQIQAYIPLSINILQYAETSSGELNRQTMRESTTDQHNMISSAQNALDDKYLVLDRYSRVKVKRIFAYEQNSGYEKLLKEEEVQQFLAQPIFIQNSAKGVQYFVDPMSVRDAKQLYDTYGPTFHLAVDPQTGQQQMVSGEEGQAPPPLQSVPGTTVQLMPAAMANAVEDGIVSMKETLVDRIKRVYSVGGVLIMEEELPISQYPVIPLHHSFQRTPYGLSPVRRVKGLQEYINNLYSLIITHADHTANMKIAYPRGGYNERQLNELWNKPGTSFIPYEAELGELKPLAPPPLPAELYKNVADAKAEVERILGIYALMQGDPNDAPNTYKGTVALEEYGQRRIKSQKDDVEEFLNQLAHVSIEMIQAYYTGYRVKRLLAPNGKSYLAAMNTDQTSTENITADIEYRINDVSVGKYDVIVVSGSMLPSNRWALAEYYTTLYKEGILDQEEVLKKTEVADVEGVLNRIGQIKMLTQQLNQAMMEIKRLRGDMQTKDRELTHALKKVEVMEFSTDLHKKGADAQAAVAVFKERTKDEIRNMQREKQLEKQARKNRERKQQ